VSGTQCPKCNVELPARGRFCLECGCDLYQAGVRRPPLPWVKGLVLLAVVAALLALVFLGSRGSPSTVPREERRVRDLTREMLRLAAGGDFREIVRRFYRPNADEFRRLDEAFHDLVHGRGAPGLRSFRSNCADDLQEARRFVERNGTPHPDYVVRLLVALTFQGEEGALRPTLGGAPIGAESAEDFAAWHLSLAFSGVDAKGAEVGDARWQDVPGIGSLLVVAVRYPEPPSLVPGLVDPATLRWRPTDDGGWALAFGGTLGLDEVLAFLLKLKL